MLSSIAPKGLDQTEQHALFSRHVRHARLQAVQESLERRGLVETIKEDTTGKPRLVTYAVPKG